MAGGVENLRYNTSLEPREMVTRPFVTVVGSVVPDISPSTLRPFRLSMVNLACPPSVITPEGETVSQGGGPCPTPVPQGT